MLRKLRIPLWTFRPTVNMRWFSDDEKFDKKKSKDEKPKVKKTIKDPDAVKRLNSLLEKMSTKPTTAIKIQTAPVKKKSPPKPAVDKIAKVQEITESIAKKIGGDVEQTESELLTKLLGLKDLKPGGTLSELISGMKIDAELSKEKRQSKEFYSKADQVRKAIGPGSVPRDRNFRDKPRRTEVVPHTGSVNLFGASRLEMFNKASTAKDPLKTWSKLEQRELKLTVTHPPSNYFEKMIFWTDQGKLWQFPIDNEQGMDEEKATDFSEHVLLEMHLEGWCPTSGPVRHFMELVCVGLADNNFLSAKEKKDHILWYRDYFEQKKDMLGDLMVMGKEQPPKLEA